MKTACPYQMRIPFGLYKGVDLDRIPSEYLLWVRGILDERDRRGALRAAIDRELARRRERESSPW